LFFSSAADQTIKARADLPPCPFAERSRGDLGSFRLESRSWRLATNLSIYRYRELSIWSYREERAIRNASAMRRREIPARDSREEFLLGRKQRRLDEREAILSLFPAILMAARHREKKLSRETHKFGRAPSTKSPALRPRLKYASGTLAYTTDTDIRANLL